MKKYYNDYSTDENSSNLDSIVSDDTRNENEQNYSNNDNEYNSPFFSDSLDINDTENINNENDERMNDVPDYDISNEIDFISDMSRIEKNKTITDTNSNINLFDQKIEKFNNICDILNQIMRNMKVSNSIRPLLHCYIQIQIKINENVTNLSLINYLNDKIIDVDIIISTKIIKIIKKILILLKKIQNCQNDEDEIQNYITKIDELCDKDIFREVGLNIKDIKEFIKYNINYDENNYKKNNNENKFHEKSLQIYKSCNGMFDSSIQPREFLQNKTSYLVYKIIICIFISIFQLYSILYPFLQGYFSIGEFFAFLIVKIFLFERICSYNLIDICINWKKVKTSLKEKTDKIIFF